MQVGRKMRPDRKKEKEVCLNNTARLAPVGRPGYLNNRNDVCCSSSGADGGSSSPSPPTKSKPSYNACPPPPDLYPNYPSAFPSRAIAGNGAVSSATLGDEEKRRRRRASSQLGQVAECSANSLGFIDSASPSDNCEGRVSSGQFSPGLNKESHGASQTSSPHPNSKPTPTKSESSNSISASKSILRPGTKPTLNSVSQNVEEINVALKVSKTAIRSDQSDCSPPNTFSRLESPLLHSSCTAEMEVGQKVKKNETPSVGCPKPMRSKDASKGSKSNAGLCTKKSASVGLDSKNSGQKGWRICTPGLTSNSCSGSLDVTADSGISCPDGDVVGVDASSGKTANGALTQITRSPTETSCHGAACTRLNNGFPDKLCNSGNIAPLHGCGMSRSSQFTEHLSPEDAAHYIETGHLLKGVLRVNAYYRIEAYVTVESLPVDILVDGLFAQNRAMEGDVVAIQVNPTSHWARLKGTKFKESSTLGVDDLNISLSNSTEWPDAPLDGEPGSTELPRIFTKDSGMEENDLRITSVSSDVIACGDNKDGCPENPSYNDAPNQGSCVPDIDGKSRSQSRNYQLKGQEHTKEIARNEKLEFEKPASDVTVSDLAALVELMPGKRPTGRVVAIVEKSKRREAVIGFLEIHGGGWKSSGIRNDNSPRKSGKTKTNKGSGSMTLTPVDNRFSKMIVYGSSLPQQLSKRLRDGDPTVSSELVVAKVGEWKRENSLPRALVTQSLGQGGTIEAQTEALLFENNISCDAFPPSVLECVPAVPWKIPQKELQERRDLRALRIFTIDPPTAHELDDALSVEKLNNGNICVGVHIADVSYFVHPDSTLDKEAQNRSTSVYLIQKVFPMLPRLLSQEFCSLNAGVDRLAFSVMWVMDSTGKILDQWIGRTIICSCVQLTYRQAQIMIDNDAYPMGDLGHEEISGNGTCLPIVHGGHTWQEVMTDVRTLHSAGKKLREGRFHDGALKLENSKLVFTLDEDGEPFDSTIYEHEDSNILVEEFMLLANNTIARVISNAFPERSLLRRHPEPNGRKLKDFENFCTTAGFDLDTSSSGSLHLSLQKIREMFQDDPVVFNILMLYATKPMQLAKYFCTGDLKDQEDAWSHYALAFPLYTHFTSPIRRYPDLLVHRTVSAALEAERMLPTGLPASSKGSQSERRGWKCFPSSSGRLLHKGTWSTEAAQKALASVAERHKIPRPADLSVIAAHCNQRRLASRNVKEGSDKLYLWTMIKRKQGILSDARVMAVGPKFMSLYVCKIGMERRIYYDEIDGLIAEWFETTGTLILSLSSDKVIHKKSIEGRGRMRRTVADVALLVNPTDLVSSKTSEETYEDLIREVEDRLNGNNILEDERVADLSEGCGSSMVVEAAVLPLTLRWFSSLPVSIHATGGESRPLDIAVRLYVSSYAI